MKRILSYIFLCALVLGLNGMSSVSAQNKAKSKKAKVVEVVAKVVDQDGRPVEDATVIAGEGALVTYTGQDGSFSIKSRDNAVILIEAEGYKDVMLNLAAGAAPEVITLSSEPFLMGEADRLDRADGHFTYRHDLTAAISTVDVDKVRSYPDLNLSNAMQGRAAGLETSPTIGALGVNSSNFTIRGQHGGTNGAIVVIDGIERSMDDLSAEEIGSIEILKDAPAKILYGPRAANGVILISTKRGEANKRIIKTSMEYGVTPSTRVPEYLDAHTYANLYNEARQNDGLSDYYLPYQIQGYRNSKGEDDLLYPDHDWYGRFTRSFGTYRKAVAEFIGGNEHVRYAVVSSYTGGSGLEKLPGASQLNRFNIRGNLDIRINDFLTASADVAARLESRKWVGKNGGDLYSQLSTLRPNEYPFIIDPAAAGLPPTEDGSLYYGASLLNTNNLYVDMTYGGDKNNRYVTSQTNIGLKFDFEKYVKGLFADAFITFDNYNQVNTGISRTYATYAVDGFLDTDGVQQMRVAQVTKINQNDNIKISDESTTRTIGFMADGGYRGSSGSHQYSAIAAFRYYKDEVLGANQNCATTNATLRLNYGFGGRFFVEAIAGLVGSNQFIKNRYLPVGSLSAAYVLSEQPFVKVKASAGRLGFDAHNNYLLYRTAWVSNGNYSLGNNNNTSAHVTNISRVGNPDLGWIIQDEANLGLEGLFLGNRLSVEANAFLERRSNMMGGRSFQYSSMIGDFLPAYNYGCVRNLGADLDIRWRDKAAGGDFRYAVGANLTVTRNKVLASNEVVAAAESYRANVGKPTSTIFGLHSLGIFGKDVNLASAPRQMFGYYTVGDLAYEDKNKDTIVDDRDETAIGQAYPLAVIGVDFDLHYKGFGLYVLGTAEMGASTLLNNTYYQNTGSNGYSVQALNRYHPVNNPTGTLPRLTTTSGSNSYRATDFWLAKDDWFRLKNVEFSYMLENRSGKGFCKTCKFFLRSTNLFVLSGIKELDPEVLNAGVTNYPVYRTFTGGVTVAF